MHALALLVLAREAKALRLEAVDVRRVDLVPVPVALPDDLGATVQLPNDRPLRVGLEDCGTKTKAHRAAEVGLGDLGHEDDDGVGVALDELVRVSVCR